MRMKGWGGIVCCFVLFIVVCVSLHLEGHEVFNTPDVPELGLLLFAVPGAVASYFSRHRRLSAPLIGAILALPVCLAMMHLWNVPLRSVWQQLAWLFSGVFWCALGALSFLFFRALRRFHRSARRRQHG